MWTNVSILYIGTGASVTGKDPIPNKDINKLITKQYQSLPPIQAKYHPGFGP